MAALASDGFNAGLGFANSYYVTTSAAAPEAPPLAGEVKADLCVVGGGCTGLSAALHAAERGLRVVLLEGGRIGWGASGRNGGQLIPGLRLGAHELVARFGRDEARRLFDLALEARRLVLDLIARHDIDCDLRLSGHLSAAAKRSHLDHHAREAEALTEVMDYPHARLLSREEVAEGLDAPGYHGGLLDLGGGYYHPLNYTLGLTRAAEAAGVALHERSVALDLEPLSTGGVRVKTDAGAVTADYVVLAGDALLDRLDGELERYIMPVASYIAVTEPSGDMERAIPSDWAVSDSRFVVNYFRRTADGRLLFGGGERYTRRPPRDAAAFVRPHIEAVFPKARDVRLDYAWGGLVSITRTRLPHVGRRGRVLFAHGYSGMGALLSTLAGALLADAIAADETRLDTLAAAAPPPFPGGAALRSPMHVLGMIWYALRDRLGG